MWPYLAILAFLGLVVVGAGWWRQRTELAALRLHLLEKREEVARLVARHRQAESDAQAQRSTLFNSMTEGVLVLDAQDRIEFVNLAGERLFGIEVEVRGRTLIEAVRHHELHDLIQRVRAEGRVLGHELEWHGPGQRSLQVNAADIRNGDGRFGGMILVFHDLTRLKQLENARKEFVANVSHELRTPLSLIKGYVETLIDGARNDPAVANRFLRTIEKHADRLTYLIEDLLTLSTLESGGVVLNLEPVEVRRLAARVVEDLGDRARGREVSLNNEVPASLMVRGDADRVQQVLFNLVDNAIKYGRQGGRITIGARQEDDRVVEIWVRDDGPGIPAGALERVFERFYRVDRARSRDQGGTGLGLAIVKHIVQAHGGDVRAESDPGRGAAFFFTLPAG